MTVDEAERSKRQAQALHEMAAISVSEAARASGEQAEGDRTAALSDSESRGQRGAGLTREQKTGWGVALIVLGVIIFIAVARDSGRRQEESRQFDQAVNRHIERQNRWKTGTMDEQYPPGTTWNYGSPSGATVFWLLLGLASVIGGIALLTSAQRPADQ
jgi:uncharacterized membrane protein